MWSASGEQADEALSRQRALRLRDEAARAPAEPSAGGGGGLALAQAKADARATAAAAERAAQEEERAAAAALRPLGFRSMLRALAPSARAPTRAGATDVEAAAAAATLASSVLPQLQRLAIRHGARAGAAAAAGGERLGTRVCFQPAALTAATAAPRWAASDEEALEE